MMIGMQKKTQRVDKIKRGKVFCRTSYKGNVVGVRQLKKKDIRFSTKSENIYIDVKSILPESILDKRNLKLKKLHNRDKFRVITNIFETVMEKILHDMIENKNTYLFPNRVKLFVGEAHTKKNKKISFFAYDTRKCINNHVSDAEFDGYVWRIFPSRKISDKLEYYSNVRQEKYIECKSSIGKQLWASYRGKQSLLMSKLRKKGLSLSSIQRL